MNHDDFVEDRASKSSEPDLSALMASRYKLSRRGFLFGVAVGTTAGAVSCFPSATDNATENANSDNLSSLTFKSIPHQTGADLIVADEYYYDVLLRWGDSLFKDVSDLTPGLAEPKLADRRAGYNCDYTAFLPTGINAFGEESGLLVVNHEYTLSNMMYDRSPLPDELSPEEIQTDMLSHGVSIVQIRFADRTWQKDQNATLNRRITPLTPMKFSGPAAGSPRLSVAWAKKGMTKGTWNNCAGGLTPWGTVLTAEENFNFYFEGDPNETSEAANHERYSLSGRSWFSWHKIDSRFNLRHDPNFALHGGWIVEVNPFDPTSTPVKHTALGRFKHEGATPLLNHDSRVVVYTADDQVFEYLYKYVSNGRYEPLESEPFERSVSENNSQLLSDGTLYVAKFHANGRLNWLPLTYGQGPLTPENGFHSQAHVLIDTRIAADLLGATPLDRPEGITVGHNNEIYLALTKNTKRTQEQVDPINSRAENKWGHVLKITPYNDDHAVATARWDMFLQGGNPYWDGGVYSQHIDSSGWFSNPDNVAIDPGGRLWIATDGANDSSGFNDGLWACDTTGLGAKLTRHFLSVPKGAEATGPSFTPDGQTLFLAVQHPGVSSAGLKAPKSRWPNNDSSGYPMPSVIAIRRKDGKTIGT